MLSCEVTAAPLFCVTFSRCSNTRSPGCARANSLGRPSLRSHSLMDKSCDPSRSNCSTNLRPRNLAFGPPITHDWTTTPVNRLKKGWKKLVAAGLPQRQFESYAPHPPETVQMLITLSAFAPSNQAGASRRRSIRARCTLRNVRCLLVAAWPVPSRTARRAAGAGSSP